MGKDNVQQGDSFVTVAIASVPLILIKGDNVTISHILQHCTLLPVLTEQTHHVLKQNTLSALDGYWWNAIQSWYLQVTCQWFCSAPHQFLHDQQISYGVWHVIQETAFLGVQFQIVFHPLLHLFVCVTDNLNNPGFQQCCFVFGWADDLISSYILRVSQVSIDNHMLSRILSQQSFAQCLAVFCALSLAAKILQCRMYMLVFVLHQCNVLYPDGHVELICTCFDPVQCLVPFPPESVLYSAVDGLFESIPSLLNSSSRWVCEEDIFRILLIWLSSGSWWH